MFSNGNYLRSTWPAIIITNADFWWWFFQMIDEFTDVNEGEKELMKLWNLHVMKNK